jgi:hypothetical protein
MFVQPVTAPRRVTAARSPPLARLESLRALASGLSGFSKTRSDHSGVNSLNEALHCLQHQLS